MKQCLVALLFLLFGAISSQAEKMTVTAYCSCKTCCGKWAKYNKTASGVAPKEGVTVAAPRAIPFGTKVFIEGVGSRVVQDRLAKKYDNRIDVYFANHKDAVKFGIKKLEVKYEQRSNK